MPIEALQEFTPVFYNETAVKHLTFHAEPRDTPNVQPHWHKRLELLYIRSGVQSVRVGGEQFRVTAGQLVVVNSRQVHAMWALEPSDYDVLMFDLSRFLNGTAASQRWLTPLAELNATFAPVTNHPAVLAAADTLIREQTEEGNPLLSVGTVYRLLGLLCAHCAAPRPAVTASDRKFNEVLDYIRAHYGDPIRTADLCRIFHYSEAYFCRLFRRMTGLTVSAYLRTLRMEQAQTLLCNSTADVAAVAAACGYPDPRYFTACFTAHFGISPTAYRQSTY